MGPKRVKRQFGVQVEETSKQDSYIMAVQMHLIDDEPDEEYGHIPIRWLTYEEGFAVLDQAA